MKVLRKIIKIDEELCDGCGQCIPSCAEGAIQIIDGKAKIIEDQFCDGLGACLLECPRDALCIIERVADEFNEKAVEDHLALIEKDTQNNNSKDTLPCGCPSTRLECFSSDTFTINSPQETFSGKSQLSNWPVKIKLIPPDANFLKGAHLLVVADCVPVAYPNLHNNLLRDKICMMGCPKFDNIQEYIDKFVEIFKKANISKISIAIMEVPCCSGLPHIVKKAIEQAYVKIPVDTIIINARGNICNNK